MLGYVCFSRLRCEQKRLQLLSERVLADGLLSGSEFRSRTHRAAETAYQQSSTGSSHVFIKSRDHKINMAHDPCTSKVEQLVVILPVL